MKLNLKKPIVFFDLETTGINVTHDRILEYSFMKISVDGTEEIKTSKIHPTIPIPKESSLIHGIYDEDVKDAPTFKDVARELNEFLKGCDLGGYNLVNFDVPVLVEEFHRVGVEFQLKGRSIVDVQKLFYLMEPRTLSGAYKFFCNKSLKDAHSAEADTVATYEVLKAQLDKYESTEIDDEDGNPYTPIVNDMASLHKVSTSKFADLAGRIIFNKEGVEVFNFGKYKHTSVSEAFRREPNYYDWMMKGDFPLYTKKVITEIKLRDLYNR